MFCMLNGEQANEFDFNSLAAGAASSTDSPEHRRSFTSEKIEFVDMNTWLLAAPLAHLVDPDWNLFECLLQIDKFDEEKSQINHDHGQSIYRKENMGLKQRFTFNNNAGKKTKCEFKGEDDDGEWESGLKQVEEKQETKIHVQQQC
ncbi:hypothetical protein V6N13_131896 [Hibiscus sabdariffa]